MIELPTERKKVTNFNPSLLVLFGKPKSGKSSIMAHLDSNLIIDLEDGYRALSVMCVQARNANDIFEICKAIMVKKQELGKNPYKYITIDNATRLEEMAIKYANSLYRQTAMGQNWGYIVNPKTGKKEEDPKADVRLLPNGSGYLYLRNAVRKMVDIFKPLCETLILVAHVKDKQIKKDGQEMSEMSVDLAGKLGDIICGEADAIGLIYREGKSTYISFEGGDNTIKEARCPHLRGKKIEVIKSDDDNNLTIDLSKVFLDD